jgi:MFS family permease
MIAQTIQLALAPVFVLVAIGNIMNLLSTRLGRVVDRSRHLQGLHMAAEGPDHDMVVAEIRLLDRRIALITRAILLLVCSGLAIGTTVAVLFLEDLANLQLQRLAAATFMVAIVLMMWALVLFLSETRIAAQQLKVPRGYLELDRDI